MIVSTETTRYSNGAAVILDKLRETAQQLAVSVPEAIETSQVSVMMDDVNAFDRDYELNYNRLNIDRPDLNAAFHFGQVAFAMQVLKQLHADDEQDALFQQVRSNSPKLSQCILALGEQEMTTSSELRKKLNMKHRSDLTNLIKRQEKYNLIASYKLGNESMHMLSRRGRECFAFFMGKSPRELAGRRAVAQTQNALYSVMDAVTESMNRNRMNRFEILDSLVQVLGEDQFIADSAILYTKLDALVSSYNSAARRTLAGQIKKSLWDSRRHLSEGVNADSGMKYNLMPDIPIK